MPGVFEPPPIVGLWPVGDGYRIECKRCGKYRISGSALSEDTDKLTNGGLGRPLLSIAVRRASDAGAELSLTSYTIPELIKSTRAARDPIEAIDTLLLWLIEHTTFLSERHSINPDTDHSAFGLTKAADLKSVLEAAKDQELLNYTAGGVWPSIKGWERANQLRNSRPRSDQAFVAMWFGDEVKPAYELGIEPALRDLGYESVRVDMREHNQKIDDYIVTEIRRSGLMVADFTGQRQSVYYEAGLADGLGIVVIRCCRADQVDDLHFDTRQFNHVVWTAPDDLRKKLRLRIAATIPGRAEALPDNTSNEA